MVASLDISWTLRASCGEETDLLLVVRSDAAVGGDLALADDGIRGRSAGFWLESGNGGGG